MADRGLEWESESVSTIEPNEAEAQLLADQDRLYDLREGHLQALYHTIDEINDDDQFFTLTLSDLEERRSSMSQEFREMEQIHHLYRQRAMLATNDILTSTSAILLDAFAKMQLRIQVLTETAQSNPNRAAQQTTFRQFATAVTGNSTINPDSQAVIRVEQAHRPQIGKFDGSMADWPAFRDLFMSEVHNRTLDPVRKLLLLKDACVGKAAETLGAWQPTAGNYQLAWEAMLAVYDDKYHIIHGLLATLHSTGKQEEETHDAIRAVRNSLTSCTRQLRAQTTPAMLDDQIWIHHGKQRLPRCTLDAWEQHRNQHHSGVLPTLDDFFKFLDSKAKARREFEHQSPLVKVDGSHNVKGEAKDAKAKGSSSQSRFKPYDKNLKNQSTMGSTNDRVFGFSSPTTCIMPNCGQLHYLGQCRLFSALSMTDRLRVVKENNLCRCCLVSGHMASKCQRKGCAKCPDQKPQHHFRLCPKATDTKPVTSIETKPSTQ